MANRIVGNVLIIDSANGNNPVIFTPGTSNQINKYKLGTVMFWSSDTTGNIQFSLADTSNQIMRLSNPVNGPNTVGGVLNGVTLQDLKVVSLTAGTAWVYLI